MLPTNSLINGKYVIGKNSVVGDPRRKWEDRVFSTEIRRGEGSPLIVGVVADGVGSADFGARGAQLAIDTFVHSLERSRGDDIPGILEIAIQAANRSVYLENQQQEGDGLTTLVTAVICRDRCYIGNVGDSRAYWIQASGKGKLLQLTRDHTYFNMFGGNPATKEAGALVNAIGKKAEIQADLGLYLKGGDQEHAYKLGVAGLPLQAGDTILLCSDGLVKKNRQQERYVTDVEIINALQTEYMPDRAAIKMVSTAEGRRPDDNVSVVTIQCMSKQIMQEMNERIEAVEIQKRNKQRVQTIRQVGIGLIGLLIVILAGFLFYKINQIKSSPTTLVITATSFPTVPAGFLFVGDLPEGASAQLTSPNRGVSQIILGQIPVVPGSQIDVLSGIISIGLPDGSALYLTEGTSLKFVNIMDPNSPTKETVLSLDRGAILVKVVSGAVVVQAFDGIVARVRGSIMGVQLSDKHYVDCYEGHCSISGNVVTPIESMDGEKRYLTITSSQLALSTVADRCQVWQSMLNPSIFNQLGLQVCIQSTPTSISPTPTTRPNQILGTPRP